MDSGLLCPCTHTACEPTTCVTRNAAVASTACGKGRPGPRHRVVSRGRTPRGGRLSTCRRRLPEASRDRRACVPFGEEGRTPSAGRPFGTDSEFPIPPWALPPFRPGMAQGTHRPGRRGLSHPAAIGTAAVASPCRRRLNNDRSTPLVFRDYPGISLRTPRSLARAPF